MNETDFLRLTAQTLSRIEQTIEHAGLDFEQPADGILEIELNGGSKIVINRHGAAQEIWVAARSGGFHFSHDGAAWRDTRDKVELSVRLAELIETQGGGAVDFSGPL
jgi:CyaY protein